ncbi:hypothetical protein AA313_de0205568 [Arthrobotrys entomopaga]|nr:hypothetical protein AA313_de0205568 [Arthrobotrys entomopaga]
MRCADLKMSCICFQTSRQPLSRWKSNAVISEGACMVSSSSHWPVPMPCLFVRFPRPPVPAPAVQQSGISSQKECSSAQASYPNVTQPSSAQLSSYKAHLRRDRNDNRSRVQTVVDDAYCYHGVLPWSRDGRQVISCLSFCLLSFVRFSSPFAYDLTLFAVPLILWKGSYALSS